MPAIIQRLTMPPIKAKVKQSQPDWDETSSARFRRSVQEWPLLPSIPEIQRRLPRNSIEIDDALEPDLLTGALDPTAQNWDTSRFIYWAGNARDDEIAELDRVPAPHPGPIVQHASLPVVLPWLDGDDPSPVFHFDLAPVAFAPVILIRSNAPHSRLVDQTEFHKSAFHPALNTLRIVHPSMPFWPVDLNLPKGTSISFGDVLVGLHKGMHERITHSDWELLDKEEVLAVSTAFTSRCRAEAVRSGVPPGQLHDREVETRNGGVKRVDFLLGKTVFKGLVWEQPTCMRLVTA
jgi:hypothetical protein